ncbi:hypothetical protein [Thalassococcus sp. S3]|uniref:hypothetical protein n=1 Tax=Thalassococcus sp. S3 TaxID=2017482 RepID=UPI0015841FA9|nr:hypothetical protein [Thalassococcus sp. S3]
MRDRSFLIDAHYADRKARLARLLFWIEARNRETDAVETIGLWTGDDHVTFAIDGQSRVYYGAGAILEIDPLVFEEGLNVRTQRLIVSAIAPEVEQMIRGYDPRLAPCEIHVAHFDPETGALIDAPERVFKGNLDKAPITQPALGDGEATAELSLLGPAYQLRRTLPLKKSDQSLRARAPDDGFRKYTDLTGAIDTYWGEIKAAAPQAKPADPPAEPSNAPEGPKEYAGR